jgi:hypothetical protein
MLKVGKIYRFQDFNWLTTRGQNLIPRINNIKIDKRNIKYVGIDLEFNDSFLIVLEPKIDEERFLNLVVLRLGEMQIRKTVIIFHDRTSLKLFVQKKF